MLKARIRIASCVENLMDISFYENWWKLNIVQDLSKAIQECSGLAIGCTLIWPLLIPLRSDESKLVH